MIFELNLGELCYYPSVVSWNGYDQSCNALDNLSDRLCVSNKTKIRF